MDPQSVAKIIHRLKSRSIEEIRSSIWEKRLGKIVFLIGAGISVASGIPDFRSKNGLYAAIRKKYSGDPEYFFTMENFESDPQGFYEILNQHIPVEVKPTDAHHFMKWMSDNDLLQRVYTQNVDGLESTVGIPEEKIARLHGDGRWVLCNRCGIKNQRDPKHKIPICSKCNGVMRPDIVFFGEKVHTEGLRMKDFDDCDCVIVMGTSLKVYPFASFINRPGTSKTRIVINNEEVEWPSLQEHKWNKFRFRSEIPRDVMIKDDVQNVCRYLMTTP